MTKSYPDGYVTTKVHTSALAPESLRRKGDREIRHRTPRHRRDRPQGMIAPSLPRPATCSPVVDIEQLVMLLRGPDAGGRCPASDELAGRRPDRGELVTCRVVVPDEGDLLDVRGEQMDPTGNWMPAEIPTHRVGIAALDGLVVDRAHRAAYLELAVAAVAAGDDTVDEHPWVAQQVVCLARMQQHR